MPPHQQQIDPHHKGTAVATPSLNITNSSNISHDEDLFDDDIVLRIPTEEPSYTLMPNNFSPFPNNPTITMNTSFQTNSPIRSPINSPINSPTNTPNNNSMRIMAADPDVVHIPVLSALHESVNQVRFFEPSRSNAEVLEAAHVEKLFMNAIIVAVITFLFGLPCVSCFSFLPLFRYRTSNNGRARALANMSLIIFNMIIFLNFILFVCVIAPILIAVLINFIVSASSAGNSADISGENH